MYFNLGMSGVPSAPPWCSTAEAARLLGVTTRTVYGFANTGELVGYRMGRVYRFRSDDIEDFLARHKIRPGELNHLLRDGSDGDP